MRSIRIDRSDHPDSFIPAGWPLELHRKAKLDADVSGWMPRADGEWGCFSVLSIRARRARKLITDASSESGGLGERF
jgi:hypothetical protein